MKKQIINTCPLCCQSDYKEVIPFIFPGKDVLTFKCHTCGVILQGHKSKFTLKNFELVLTIIEFARLTSFISLAMESTIREIEAENAVYDFLREVHDWDIDLDEEAQNFFEKASLSERMLYMLEKFDIIGA